MKGRSLYTLFVISVLSLVWQSAIAQSFSGCFPTTPTFNVDLRDNPDSLWISPRVVRRGLCCGYDPAANPPIRCVQFRLTLDDDAVGIIFNIASGAVPPGALGYSIDCGPLKFPGEVVCLSGPWPKYLTFCKPGANPNTYSILSIGKPKISPPITVSDGCTGVIGVTGLDINTIKWTSVPNNPVHNSYLNCVEKCSTVVATYQPGAPDSVVYEASGQITGNCSTVPFRATTKVYFINNKKVEILPKNPVVCFGSSGAVITAYPSGGRPPYKYLWSTGQTTQSIQVGEGTYSVQVTDASSCPGTANSVTVTSFKLPIVANAGPDMDVCRYNNTVAPVQLQGSVQAVVRGRWSGGLGSFSPNDSTLNAVYRPTLQEIINGSVTLRLTTIGNADCPPNSDVVSLNFRDPVRVLVADRNICAGSSVSVLAPFVSGLSYQWSLNGSTVSNSNSYNFTPSGSVNLVLTTVNQFGCTAKDTVAILVQPKPVVVMPDQNVCAGKNVVLNATPSNVVSSPIAYSWLRNGVNLGANTASITTAQPGTYTVFVSTGVCTVSDTAVVSNFVIDVKANSPGFLCRNSQSGINLTASRINTSKSRWFGNGTFLPNDTAKSVSFFPSPAELTRSVIVVVLKSEGNIGCVEDVDSVKINIAPSPILIPPTVSVCIGNIGTISSNLPDSLNPRWYTQTNVFLANGSSFTAKFDSTTFLTIKAQSATGCKDSATAKVTAYTKPQLDIRDTTICNGGAAMLDARLLNVFQGFGSYSWSRNAVPLAATTSALNVLISGKYTVEYGVSGCKTKDSAMVNVFNIQVQANGDQYVCKNAVSSGLNLSTLTSNSAKVKWIGNGGTFSPNDSSKVVTYVPSLAESAGSESKIIIQTVGNGVCKEARDSVMIFFKPYNLATGTSETVCEGENSILSSPLVAGMQYIWKNMQGVVVGNSNQIVVNVKADTAFRVRVTNANGCSDSTVINVQPFPRPIIKIDGATTCLGDSLQLNGSPLNKSETFVQPIFQWYKDGTLLPKQDSVLKVGVSGIYTLRYGKGICVGTDTARMVFTMPTIDLNPIAPICIETGRSLLLNASQTNSDSVTWQSNGTGVFEIVPTKGRANYLPSNADFTSTKIKITAQTYFKNLRCSNVKDSTEITILPSPIANGIGDTVCVGESAVLQTTIPSNWNAQWYSAGGALLSSLPTFSVVNASNQTYTLVVQDPNGCKDTTTIPLVTFNKPIVVLNDTLSCLGDTLELKPNLIASLGVARKYVWYKNGLLFPEKTEILKVTESGNYSLVFGESGCLGTDNAVVVLEEPSLSVVQPAPICRNYTGLINLKANVNLNRKIRWIGEGVFAPSDSAPEVTYKPSNAELASDSFRINVETIQNLKCTGVADKAIVKVLKSPQPKAVSDTVCVGDSVTLTTMLNAGETVRWIDNSIVKSTNLIYKFPILASGTILLKVSNTNGCVDSTMVPFTTFAKPLLQLNDIMTCLGDRPVLNGIPSNFNPSNVRYTWFKNNVQLPNTTSVIIVSDSGLYKLRFGIGNCTALDSAKVTFFRPSLIVSGDNAICRNVKEINFNAIYTNADGLEWSTKSGVLPALYQSNTVKYPYLASDIVGDKSIFVFARLKQNNPSCPVVSKSIEVLLKESPFLITNGDTVCKSSTAVVSVEQEFGTSYVWRDGLANSLSNSNRYSYSPTKSERLYLIAQNLNGCADSAKVDVKLVAPANVSIQNTPACTGQLLTLRMVVPNDTVPGLKNIKWFNKGVKIGENINPIQYSASGNYTVIYSNIYCKDTANSNIVFNPSPLVEKEPPIVFCPESNPQVQLDAGQYAKYVWQADTSVKVRYYQANKEGDYKVLVYNQFDCSAEKIFSVKEVCKPRLFVPNAFTPGGSNNNLFKVQYANVKNYQMLIFNRWGEIIFESLDPAISWDGIYRNEMMPMGVYAWVVTYEGNQEKYKGPYKAQGSVTLIR